MSDFGNIFSDAVDTLEGWLTSDTAKDLAIAGAGALIGGSRSRQSASLGGQPNSVTSVAESTNTKAVMSEDPLAHETLWKNRLSTFLEIDRNTAVQGAKA